MEDKKLQELSENDLQSVVGGLGSLQYIEFMRCDDVQSATICLKDYGILSGTAQYNQYMALWESEH